MALTKPISENDIGNMALVRLKQEPTIQNIDPPTSVTENLVAEVFISLRRANIRKYPWNFAIKRIAISSDTAVPLFGFKKQFTFPPDFLRYLNRFDADGGFVVDGKENYQIERNKLLLNDDNQDTARIRYIFDNTIVAEWDPLFVELMVLEIAIAISSNFVGGKGWVASLKQDLLDVQTQARAIDGQERPPVHRIRSKWVQSRRGLRRRDNSRIDFR